jgi:hypothetical protein
VNSEPGYIPKAVGITDWVADRLMQYSAMKRIPQCLIHDA